MPEKIGNVVFKHNGFLVTATINPLPCKTSMDLLTTTVTLSLLEDNTSKDNKLPLKQRTKTLTHRGELTTTVIDAIFCVTDTASGVIGGLYSFNLRELLSEN